MNIYIPGGKFLLITLCAVDVIVAWDKGASPNWIFADDAAEALLMPLMALILHLLRTCTIKQPKARVKTHIYMYMLVIVVNISLAKLLL